MSKVEQIRKLWDKKGGRTVRQITEFAKPKAFNKAGEHDAEVHWVTEYTFIFGNGTPVKVAYNRELPSPTVEQIVEDIQKVLDGRD